MLPSIHAVISGCLGSCAWFFQTIASQVDNREIATSILLFAFLALAVFLSKNRSTLFKSFIDVTRSALKPRLIVPAFICIVYSVAIMTLACRIGVWSADVLLDTILEIVFVGIPSMAIAVNAKSIKSMFKQLVLPEIGFGAFVAAYIGIESFSIPIELVLQSLLMILSCCQVIWERQPNGTSAIKFSNWMVALIGIWAFCAMTCQLISTWNTVDWFSEAQSCAMTIWYPLLLMPFVILLGYYSELEMMALRMKSAQSSIRLASELHLILMLIPSIKNISHFNGYIAGQYSKCKSRREEKQFVDTLKADTKTKTDEAQAKQKRMENGKGIAGFDKEGVWRDWSNLKKIKDELWLVFNMQFGFYRNNGAYSSDVSVLLDASTPIGCTNGYFVSRDCQTLAWWITNGTGFTLGLAASNGTASPLRYEGVGAPTVDEDNPLDAFGDETSNVDYRNWFFDFRIDESYL